MATQNITEWYEVTGEETKWKREVKWDGSCQIIEARLKWYHTIIEERLYNAHIYGGIMV